MRFQIYGSSFIQYTFIYSLRLGEFVLNATELRILE